MYPVGKHLNKCSTVLCQTMFAFHFTVSTHFQSHIGQRCLPPPSRIKVHEFVMQVRFCQSEFHLGLTCQLIFKIYIHCFKQRVLYFGKSIQPENSRVIVGVRGISQKHAHVQVDQESWGAGERYKHRDKKEVKLPI